MNQNEQMLMTDESDSPYKDKKNSISDNLAKDKKTQLLSEIAEEDDASTVSEVFRQHPGTVISGQKMSGKPTGTLSNHSKRSVHSLVESANQQTKSSGSNVVDGQKRHS